MFTRVRLPFVFQAWDDVVRKEKPKEDAFEYKKRLTLDHEKSKLSLAEIYEQEYIKLSQVRRSPRPWGGVPPRGAAVMAETLGTRKPCSGVTAPRGEAASWDQRGCTSPLVARTVTASYELSSNYYSGTAILKSFLIYIFELTDLFYKIICEFI